MIQNSGVKLLNNDLEKIAERRKRWEEGPLKFALARFKFEESPTRFYTPLDIKDFNFLEKVGFPGEYPYTACPYPTYPYAVVATKGSLPTAKGLVRAARYSGYGTPEDTRDYYKQMQAMGQRAGPNLALDLPTQCGYDSDNPVIRGEVGKVGVSIDTLRDFEVIYEPFQGEKNNLDRIASNFTINAPANILVSMYIALADKRGIPMDKLRATPQNDILKEFVARGTYIFPPKPSMRMMRDSIIFFTKNLPKVNITSIGGYHIREAGASRVQDLAFSMAIAIAYLQEGVNAGLEIDSFAPKFTFNAFGGSMEFFKEIAFQRAARRTYARILKERFGAKDFRSMIIRMPITAHIGCSSTTAQRPLNNLARTVVGAIAGALSGGPPMAFPPYDEPLGLGWSLEACQLSEDASRILQYEAKLNEVIDPLAGSYYIESLTDEIEAAAWQELEKIDAMGGAVAAIESGYMQREIARSAHERQQKIERGEELVIGVNCFTDEAELDVTTSRLIAHPYDPVKREKAEEQQIRNLTEVKRTRDNRLVSQLLQELKAAAKKEEENLMPCLINCAKAYASEQEMCDVLREVFGEYEPVSLF
ncbi:MAG: methylmalonyl-CoA mutase [Peptococcaceae bacterium]|nr:MAG: methylmalonyl-CoA mutase [Peptococcaceae bacterium]